MGELNQHYSPGTQENYKIFSSSNLIMGKAALSTGNPGK